MAYTTLNDDVVQPLLTVNIESDDETIAILKDSLLSNAKIVRDLLHAATEASTRICTTVDEQIIRLVLSIQNQEKLVSQNQEAVTQANINVQYTQNQIQAAEAAVRNSQHSLNVANNEVEEAQIAVEKARVCGMGRRKRRFLDGIIQKLNPVRIYHEEFIQKVNPEQIFRDIIAKPVCSVINYAGIDSAKARREIAEQNLHETQDHLHTYQQNLANQRAHYNSAQLQLNASTIHLQTSKSTLSEQRVKQALMSSLTEQLKNVDVHLNNVLAPSDVLVNAIADLVDFELVIKPLDSISEVIINNNIMESFGFEISADTVRQIKVNLKKLTEKVPFISMQETDSEEVTDAPETDSEQVTDSLQLDSEEVTDAPETDAEEVTDSPETDAEEVTDALETDSEEDHAHGHEITDEEVNDDD